MLKEFKEFAVKGNVVDMAIGIIIGGAFGKIVTSLVTDVIMPPIGILLGGVDFSGFSLTLKQASDAGEAVTLNYGVFVNTLLNFLVVSFAMFLLVKQMNKLKKTEEKKEEKKEVKPSEELLVLREIRDSLKKKPKPKK